MRFPFLNKRITPLLPITIILFILVLVIFFLVPPSTQIPLGFTSFSIRYVALTLVYLLFFGIGTLIFKTRLNGTLLALFVISFLVLRLNDLKHPIFFVILAALFITVEFYFSQSGRNAEGIKKIDPTGPSHKARHDKK